MNDMNTLMESLYQDRTRLQKCAGIEVDQPASIVLSDNTAEVNSQVFVTDHTITVNPFGTGPIVQSPYRTISDNKIIIEPPGSQETITEDDIKKWKEGYERLQLLEERLAKLEMLLGEQKNPLAEKEECFIPAQEHKQSKKCECGTDVSGGGMHSTWCPKFEKI